MDIATLVTTAFTLASPFLSKTGEALAEKIGEDVWNLIKKPFVKKGKEITKEDFINNSESIKLELTKELEANPELRNEFVKTVQEAQTKLEGNFQQNINSYDKVEKQVNIQNNTGNISM